MNKLIKFTAGLIATFILTGCGSDSNDDNQVSRFDINDYQAVENSSSLEGIWVGISNYTEETVHTGENEGLVDSDRVSKRRIFRIIKDPSLTSGYSIDHLFYGPMPLSITEDHADFIISGAMSLFSSSIDVIVTNNNRMTGTLSNEKGDQDWVFIKTSNEVDSIGSVSVSNNWSNSPDSNDEYLAMVLLEEIRESKNNMDGHSYEHSYELSFDESLILNPLRRLLIAKEDRLNTANDKLSVFINGFKIESSEGNVEITTSQSNSSSLITEFSGTDDIESNSVILTANLSF